MSDSKKPYGQELILDLYDCGRLPCSRLELKGYLTKLCTLIEMEREDLHFWDYDGDPVGYDEAPDHLKGTSAVQFIRTSNITIHTLDALGKVLINIFSCKDFDVSIAVGYTEMFFNGKVLSKAILKRG